MRILYLATAGASDPTRASVPLHIAVNGSVEAGQDCAIALVGDATELAVRDVAGGIEGLGVPPAAELLEQLREHQVPVYV